RRVMAFSDPTSGTYHLIATLASMTNWLNDHDPRESRRRCRCGGVQIRISEFVLPLSELRPSRVEPRLLPVSVSLPLGASGDFRERVASVAPPWIRRDPGQVIEPLASPLFDAIKTIAARSSLGVSGGLTLDQRDRVREQIGDRPQAFRGPFGR